MPPSPPQSTLFGSPFTPVQTPSHLPGSVPAATATNTTFNASHKRLAKSELESSDRYSRTFSCASNVLVTAFERVITIIVGPNRTVFNVPESKLRSKAEYFKVALAGNWKEAKDGAFTLKEENASVFGLLVNWLYYDRIDHVSPTPDTEIFLIEAYLLGDRRGSEGFRNDVLDSLKTVWMCVLPSSKAILLAFSEETHAPNLRKLVADKHAWEGKHDTLLQQATAGLDGVVHPGCTLAVHVAILRRISTATVTLPESKCKGTHNPFSITDKHDFVTVCRNVGCVESRHEETRTKFCLGSEKDAPYVLDFCAHYHEHSKSVKGFKCSFTRHGTLFGSLFKQSSMFGAPKAGT